jgi:hypothetical protein
LNHKDTKTQRRLAAGDRRALVLFAPLHLCGSFFSPPACHPAKLQIRAMHPMPSEEMMPPLDNVQWKP